MDIDQAIHQRGARITIQTKRGCELGWHLNTNPAWRKIWDEKEVFDEVYKLCRKSFSVPDSAEFEKDVRNHILNVDGICIVMFGNVPKGLSPACFKTSRVAAFASYNLGNWEGKNFVYFPGVVVDPSLFGLNYGSILIQKVMEITEINLGALRTQSPVMYKSFSKVCRVYPSELEATPEWAKNFGEHIAATLNMSNYDRERMTEQETYGHSLYGENPVLTRTKSSLNGFFGDKVNVDRGDSIILIGTRNGKCA